MGGWHGASRGRCRGRRQTAAVGQATQGCTPWAHATPSCTHKSASLTPFQITVSNFIDLAENGFFDGQHFHKAAHSKPRPKAILNAHSAPPILTCVCTQSPFSAVPRLSLASSFLEDVPSQRTRRTLARARARHRRIQASRISGSVPKRPCARSLHVPPTAVYNSVMKSRRPLLPILRARLRWDAQPS